MTKMTVLHFASPFAFSAPAPVPPARRTGAAREEAAAAAPLPSTKDGPSVAFAADTVLPESVAAAEGAGLAGSAYDTVVRRYREQGSATGADTASSADEDAASD